GAGLGERQFGRDRRRPVHALEAKQEAGIVDDRHRHVPFVLVRLGHAGRHHLLHVGQREARFAAHGLIPLDHHERAGGQAIPNGRAISKESVGWPVPLPCTQSNKTWCGRTHGTGYGRRQSTVGQNTFVIAIGAGTAMHLIRLYVRVLRLLGPERKLGWILAAGNLALAAAQFAEPVLFGKVIDTLAGAQARGEPPSWYDLLTLLAAWVGFGLFTIVCGTLVALHADRLSHRRRLAVLTDYFE